MHEQQSPSGTFSSHRDDDIYRSHNQYISITMNILALH